MMQIYNQEEIKLSQSPWQENIKGDFHFTRPNALSPFIDLLECPQQAQPALDRLIMGDLYPSLFIYSPAGQFHMTTCGYPWEKKRNVFCPPQVTFPLWKSIPPRKPFSQKAAIQHGSEVPPGRMKYLQKPSLWTEWVSRTRQQKWEKKIVSMHHHPPHTLARTRLVFLSHYKLLQNSAVGSDLICCWIWESWNPK